LTTESLNQFLSSFSHQLVEFSTSPQFYSQIGLILLAVIIAFTLAALFKKHAPLLRSTPGPGPLLSFRKQQTTIDPRYPHKTSSIVTGGIYNHTRNPMYLGLVLILSATSIYFATRFGFFVIAAFILYMNAFQIKPEEEALEKQFGKAYLNYKSKVRRWI